MPTLETCCQSLPGREDWDTPVSQESVRDILQKARGKLVDNGWWHPHKENAPNSMPLSDGLIFSYLEACGYRADGDKRTIIEAYRALASTLGIAADGGVVIWDSREGCTEAEMFSALDRTIAVLGAEPNT
jgi:hypothetical protein